MKSVPFLAFRVGRTQSNRSIVARYFNKAPAGELFDRKPGRRVYRETDFCDGTGRVFRMDRVVVDEDAVTVVDFKTGADAGRVEADRTQIR